MKTIIPNKRIKIKYDLSKPNGTPRKLLDVSLAKKYGWQAKMKLKEAILLTYKSYLKDNRIVKKIIVITGGAGFIGSNLIELILKKTKFNLISLDNYSSGTKKNHIRDKKSKISKR